MFASTGSGSGVKGRLTLCKSYIYIIFTLGNIPEARRGITFLGVGAERVERGNGARERERWNWSRGYRKKQKKSERGFLKSTPTTKNKNKFLFEDWSSVCMYYPNTLYI